MQTRLNAKPGTYLLKQLIQTLQDINAQVQYKKAEEPNLLDAVMEKGDLSFSVNDGSIFDANQDIFFDGYDDYSFKASLISEKTKYKDQEGHFYISVFGARSLHHHPEDDFIKIGFFREGVERRDTESVTLNMKDISKDDLSRSRLSALLNFVINRL